MQRGNGPAYLGPAHARELFRQFARGAARNVLFAGRSVVDDFPLRDMAGGDQRQMLHQARGQAEISADEHTNDHVDAVLDGLVVGVYIVGLRVGSSLFWFR